MEQADLIAATLREKVEALAQAYQKRGQALRQAGEQIALLTQALEKEKQTTRRLEEEINELKTAQTFEPNQAERHAVKAKIGAMIREIDKCIALLNQ